MKNAAPRPGHVGRLPNRHVLPVYSGASFSRHQKARRGGIAMRARACTILCIGAILIAAPAWAAGGRYDPDYPICMEGVSSEGTRIDCLYTSMEQCRQGTIGGSSGTCFNNPYYVSRPAEAAPAAPVQTEPELPARPKKNMGRYDPDYAVCMEAISSDGTRLDCVYTSMEQCKQGTLGGSSGNCFNNPAYVAPPPEPAIAPPTEPAPVKRAKPAKSAKPAKPPQSPPPPQPVQSQQR
jgi:hypothetical protein